MLRQYFLAKRRRTVAIAWSGLAFTIGYSMMLAFLKYQLNDFYGDFYNLLQTGGDAPHAQNGVHQPRWLSNETRSEVSQQTAPNFTTILDIAQATEAKAEDRASGEDAGAFHESDNYYSERKEEVFAKLVQFLAIVAPYVFLSPICKYLRSRWLLKWRMELMRDYVSNFERTVEIDPSLVIEGTSQRIQEDSQRFVSGISSIVLTVLDSVFTLFVFVPVLLSIGSEVRPPPALAFLSGSWLVFITIVSALFATVGPIAIGRKLVGIEVLNQLIEARIRKSLVFKEEQLSAESTRARLNKSNIEPTIVDLNQNYKKLYFTMLNVNYYTGFIEQAVVFIPLFIVSPRIFEEDGANRVTLGVLIQLTNTFDKVFTSLCIIADNFVLINEFLSVLRRLRQFELTTSSILNGRVQQTAVVQLVDEH
jgi:ABC-type long-subunit fatty acid transport system fused permease/ATPase subunit